MQSTTQASAFEQLQLKYLQRLAEQYPTIDKAAVEIINLQAILNFQKEQNILSPIFTANMRHFLMY